MPAAFLDGRIDRVDIEIPWKQLINSPIAIRVDGFQVALRVAREDFAGYLRKTRRREAMGLVREFQRKMLSGLRQGREDWAKYLEKEVVEKIQFELSNFSLYLVIDEPAEAQVVALSVGRLRFCDSPDYKEIKRVEVDCIEVHAFRAGRGEGNRAAREDLRELRRARGSTPPVVRLGGLSVKIFKDALNKRINYYASVQTVAAELSHRAFSVFGHFADAFELIRYLRTREDQREGSLRIKDPALAREVLRFEMIQRIQRIGRWKYRRAWAYPAKLEKFELAAKLEFCRAAEQLEHGAQSQFNPDFSVSLREKTYSAKALIQEGLELASLLHPADLRAILERACAECGSEEGRHAFLGQHLQPLARKPSMLQKLFKQPATFQNFFEKVQSKVSKRGDEAERQQVVYYEHHLFSCNVEAVRVGFENRADVLLSLEVGGVQFELLQEINFLKVETLRLLDGSECFTDFAHTFLQVVHRKAEGTVEAALSPFRVQLNSFALAKLYFCFSHALFRPDRVQLRRRAGPGQSTGRKTRLQVAGPSSLQLSTTLDFSEGLSLAFDSFAFETEGRRLTAAAARVEHFSEESGRREATAVVHPVDVDLSLDEHVQLLKFDDVELEVNEPFLKFAEGLQAFWAKLTAEFVAPKTERAVDAEPAVGPSPSQSRKGSVHTV